MFFDLSYLQRRKLTDELIFFFIFPLNVFKVQSFLGFASIAVVLLFDLFEISVNIKGMFLKVDFNFFGLRTGHSTDCVSLA